MVQSMLSYSCIKTYTHTHTLSSTFIHTYISASHIIYSCCMLLSRLFPLKCVVQLSSVSKTMTIKKRLLHINPTLAS